MSTPANQAPSDFDLITKKTAYDKGRSLWARGELSPPELETLYASYMRARATYSSQQSLYGQHVPPANPLPRLDRLLEDAKLARDDVSQLLRKTKQEERTLLDKAATSPSAEARGLANIGLKQLHDEADPQSIPAISAKSAKAEDRVKTLETQLRVARREN
jgi:hypothetical protein